MGGFGAVPEELRQAAVEIGDAGDKTAGMVWRGPSGDYGHEGVAGAWEEFIRDMRAFVEQLREQTEAHAAGLRDAASSYGDVDVRSAVDLGRISGSLGVDIAQRLGTGTTPLKPVDREGPVS